MIVKGKMVKPEQVMGPERKGRKIVYSGDTRPCENIARESAGADVLIHDGTMADDLRDWAVETKHSTVGEAADIAKKAKVKKLILTHISSRYSENTEPLVRDARKVMDNVIIAEELMEIEIPFFDK